MPKLKKKKIYSLLLCINIHQDFIFHLELMCPISLIRSFVNDSVHPYISFSSGTAEYQFSVVLTWMEDRTFPILWKSGVTRMPVRLLHTTWTDGKSIMKLWIMGITTQMWTQLSTPKTIPRMKATGTASNVVNKR